MNPSQFDALTRKLAQLQVQLAIIQTKVTATREESKDLATRVNILEQNPHST